MTISDEIIQLMKSKLTHGMPKVDIAKDLNISLRTVQMISSGQRSTRCSNKVKKRINKSNSSIKRAVRVINKEGARVSAEKVCDILSETISPCTVRKRLHSIGYRYKSVADQILLTEKQKQKRVDTVRKMIYEKIDMDQVIFSDECKFTLDGNDGSKTWVTKINKRRRKRRFKGGSVMVWGCITRSGLIILRKVKGSLTSAKYCSSNTK